MSEQLPFLDFRVEPHDDHTDLPLARALKEQLPDLSWGRVRELCSSGKVKVDGDKVLDGRRKVPAGARITLEPTAPARPALPKVDLGLRIYLEDSQVLVFEKPPGVATVPYEDQERVTVLDLVRRTWRKAGKTDPSSALFVVQRLDKETSGIMVLARTEQSRSVLERQLRAHQVGREYLAVVHGVIEKDTLSFDTVIAADRGDGLRGSVKHHSLGKQAITHVEVIERMAEATLIKCTLETGRTHQIRIHLSEAGFPLLGEKVYIREYKGRLLPAPRVALHATRLSFRHPTTGRTVKFYSSLPADLVTLVRELGGTLEPLKSRIEAQREARLARAQQKTFEHSVRDWWADGAPRPIRSPRREAGEARPRREGPGRPGEAGRDERPARSPRWERGDRPDRQAEPIVRDRDRPDRQAESIVRDRDRRGPGRDEGSSSARARPFRARLGDSSAGIRATRSPAYNPAGARRLVRPQSEDPEAAQRARKKELDSLAKSAESLTREVLQSGRRSARDEDSDLED